MSEDSDRDDADPGVQGKVKGLWSTEVGAGSRRYAG